MNRLGGLRKINGNRLFTGALISVIVLLVVLSCSKEKIFAPTDETTYYDDIKYIFTVKCATSGCHAGESPAAGLSLETYENIVAGSAHGSVVIPGKADKSLLFGTVAWTTEPVMPSTEKLDQIHIDLIAKWINDGLFRSRQ